MDYVLLDRLRRNHPGWRLLCAQHSVLVVSFLHRVFIAPNKRYLSQSELVESLEDELFNLKEKLCANTFKDKESALEYLNDWAKNEKGWLRKYYRAGSDEPYFDLTPATEKAISWLESLSERSFVGTESRLLTLFDLLKQICSGTQTDPAAKLQELNRKKLEIEAEIEAVKAGKLSLMDDTAIKERFMQFESIARDLLGDFREVEQNFRSLDRAVREQIAMREENVGKGAVIAQILERRDEITESDQGRSFRGFFDFLMANRQEEFTQLLDQVWQVPAINTLRPDTRLKKVHYDWLDAGANTQNTVAMLSNQLRRFLDDTAWLENRRIMEVLKNIEQKALKLRDLKTSEFSAQIDTPSIEIELPFERPLFKPKIKVKLVTSGVSDDSEDIETDALFEQNYVDTAALTRHVNIMLSKHGKLSLSEVINERPISLGLSEIMAYMHLATSKFVCQISDEETELLSWTGDDGLERLAEIPLVTFLP